MNGDNYYFLEVSTHRGLVHFHTTKANGEPYGYDVQINTKEGFIKIQDDKGQMFYFDSGEKQIVMQNPDGCSFEINKKNMTIIVPETYTVKAKNVIEEVGEAIKTKAGQSISNDTKEHKNKADNYTTQANSLTEEATTVLIEGSATVTITGGSVNIN